MSHVIQYPIAPNVDLRDMLRQHLIGRSLACMAQAAQRRQAAAQASQLEPYRQTVRASVRNFYGELPLMANGAPLRVKHVSTFIKRGYRLENVLFDAFPGWEINATVYVPLDFTPPFPAVVIPVGHSGKQFEHYQLPAQFFARCGYLAIMFDPPGQSGEKQSGNDHFVDGVRPYLVGESSSRYFVADALRCIDYAQTRPDVDLARGVAMTGVSGGGTTTLLAGVLDDRITVLGPSCCVSPLADLDITQCYAGCPETHMWQRYAEGVDEVDLLCAASPKPALLMAGKFDEVFQIQDTRRLAEEVQAFYQSSGVADRFEFFVDEAGHSYSLAQARKFVRFMDRWLRAQPDRRLPDLPDDAFSLDTYDELRCHPRTDVNMRTLTLDRAKALSRVRTQSSERVRSAAAQLMGVNGPVAAPELPAGQRQHPNPGVPFRVWTHHWQQVLLQPEEGVQLPGTFVYAEQYPTAAILHLDDGGRNRHLYRHGLLAQAAQFIEREAQHAAVFSVDLRGWGDSSPAMYPYEMAGWGGIDRTLAYMSNALGDPVMAMRVRDGLAALAYLRTRSEVDGNRIVITGCGLGAVVALHVAAIDDSVQGVLTWDGLFSFYSLLEHEHYTWPADAFVPNVLLHYDLPELGAAMRAPVIVCNPLDGAGRPVPDETLVRMNAGQGKVTYKTVSRETMVHMLRDLLGNEG